MFELLALGPDRRQRVRCSLPPEETVCLGRDVAADLPIPWDPYISRRHADLKVTADGVEVTKRAEAVNPLFYLGEPVESCRLRGGEHFVIGSTSFQIVQVETGLQLPLVRTVEEVTFEPHELEQVRFRDADRRIDVLSRLPEVIWGARTDTEFFDRLVQLVLAGVTRSDAVAVVKWDRAPGSSVRVVHWDRRRETAGEFRASSRLIRDALCKRRRTILHVWEPERRAASDYTEVAEFDWAFCTPVTEQSSDPWGLYVAGRLERYEDNPVASVPDVSRLQADVKFTELLAEIVRSVQRLKNLEQRQAGLRQFFAPAVLSALEDDPKLLEPRECDVTVLFCDLRGFSHRAEESASDLIGFLERVSLALGIMREQIMKYGGVTGDFQGDAALGFWGWPFASDEAPLNACRAALGIRAEFAKTRGQQDHPLAARRGENRHRRAGQDHRFRAGRQPGQPTRNDDPPSAGPDRHRRGAGRDRPRAARSIRGPHALPGKGPPLRHGESGPGERTGSSCIAFARTVRSAPGPVRPGSPSLHRRGLGTGVSLPARYAGQRPGPRLSAGNHHSAQPLCAARLERSRPPFGPLTGGGRFRLQRLDRLAATGLRNRLAKAGPVPSRWQFSR